MRRKNQAPVARCEGRVQGLWTPRQRDDRGGQRGIQPGALPRSPTLASCVLSFPQDSLLPSFPVLPLALLVGYECHLLPPRWRQRGGDPVSSHSCDLTPPQLPVSVSLSLSHTHTRPHTFGCLQEELGAQGCTWGSCGQNVRKTPQMAQPCSRESSEVSGGQFPLVSHCLRLPTPLRSGPCLTPDLLTRPPYPGQRPHRDLPHAHRQRTAGVPIQGVGPTFSAVSHIHLVEPLVLDL